MRYASPIGIAHLNQLHKLTPAWRNGKQKNGRSKIAQIGVANMQSRVGSNLKPSYSKHTIFALSTNSYKPNKYFDVGE